MNERLRSFLTHTAVAVAGVVGGFLVQDFTSFRSDVRLEQRAAVDARHTVEGELFDVLVSLKDVANGDRPSSPEDVDRLRGVLLKDRQAAERLVDVVPSTRNMLPPFERASVELLQQAQRFDGPLQAARMTEALDEYLYTRHAFGEAVSSARASYVAIR